MVRIVIKKNEHTYTLDLEQTPDIKYFKRAQDLANVEKVSSSYTIDFKIPKTKHNIEVFGLLSFVGDQSRMPYEKIRADLFYWNHTIIKDGIVNVITSDKTHISLNLQATTIDFSNAIKDKFFGKDIDLSALNHIKNLSTVEESHHNNLPYCYILADYNGNAAYKNSQAAADAPLDIINIEYLVPSIRISYLFDRLFETIGFTYTGAFFRTQEWQDNYITFPSTTKLEIKGNSTYIDQKQDNPQHIKWKTDSKKREFFYIQFAPRGTIENGSFNENYTKYFVPETGEYTLYMSFEYEGHFGQALVRPFINGKIPEYNPSPEKEQIKLKLNAGDEISVMLIRGGLMSSVKIKNYHFKLTQDSTDNVNWNVSFEKLSCRDFMQEIYRRFSLVPFETMNQNQIEFLTLDERLNYWRKQNLSHAYIERTAEYYGYSTYAKTNRYRHLYNDKNADYNDGFIVLDNENKENEKTLFTSKFYTHNIETSTYDIFSGSPVIPMYDVELKVEGYESDGSKKFTYAYKPLKDHFYIIKRKKANKLLILGSPFFPKATGSTKLFILDTHGTDYKTIIQEKYAGFSRILSDTRIHHINLDLNLLQDEKFDLKTIYYFDQEKSYYLLNELIYQTDKEMATGIFIRLKP